MKTTQVYELVNTASAEALGRTGIVNEDLTGLVDVGTEIFNATAVDKYTKSLINQIGKMVFVNRPYYGSAPSVLMDSWEFGSVLEKVSGDLPEATINETWELEDGQSYDTNIFHRPKISVKFFNSMVTFELDRSYTERQIKQSFQSANQMNAFLSMLYNDVEKSMTVKLDNLVMRTINNMIGETINDNAPTRAINLWKSFKTLHPTTTLTWENCIYDPEFLRHATLSMANYMDRIQKMSTLFNIGEQARFTPKELLHVVMLSDFKNGANVYLQSSTFNEEYTALPNAETVAYWQGSGTEYRFNEISAINIKTSSGNLVEQAGILCVMFDRDALGVQRPDRRVTTHWNAKGEFVNNFYKWDAGYFNDLNENFVVFYVADET